MSFDYIEPFINDAAQSMRIDKNLIKAIILIESNCNHWAARYEPKTEKYLVNPDFYAKRTQVTIETEITLQKMSIGLMQTMGFVVRELGFAGPLTMLTDPQISVFYGTKKLRQLSDKYLNENDVISSYNQGSPIRITDGGYKNQDYVDKVVFELAKLRGNNIPN